MGEFVRRVMALLSTTADADRRQAQTEAVLSVAEDALAQARSNLAGRARAAANLDRWARLYRERMRDQVDVP